VTGVSTANALPLQVSIAAVDLGPIIAPEPSTWTMMLLGVAGLGVVARRRRRSAVVSETRTTTQPFLTALRVCFPDSKSLANLSFSTASRRLRPTNSWRVGDFSVYFPDESPDFSQVRRGETSLGEALRAEPDRRNRARRFFITAVTH
jgi:PEP-CTERM motif